MNFHYELKMVGHVAFQLDMYKLVLVGVDL